MTGITQTSRGATAIRLLLVLLSVAFLPTQVRAENKPSAAPAMLTQRITGLFAPDREADLRVMLQAFPGVELMRVDFDSAEVTFRYDPAAAFPEVKPADVTKHFTDKLRTASNNTFNLLPLDPNVAKDRLTRVEIPIDGLDCRACSLVAYEVIMKVDGVYQATASFRERKATALIDPAKASRNAIVEALKTKHVSVPETDTAAK